MLRGGRMKKVLKSIYSGFVGAVQFFVIAIMVFAIVKILYLLMKKDFILSQYSLSIVVLLFLLLGFAYGVRSFHKSNKYYKMFHSKWSVFWLDVLISFVFTLAIYIILTEGLNYSISGLMFIGTFIILFVLNYGFSALVISIHNHKKAHFRKSRGLLAFLMNPVFVLLYFWLFSLTVYNAVYVPCGVSIAGVDNNPFTRNTMNLDIKPGEKIVSIDNVKLNSLNEVRSFIDSLESTKEVAVETENNLYYIKTYMQGNNRYMGLILKQDYCARK